MTLFAALIVYLVFYYYAVSKPETKKAEKAQAEFMKAIDEVCDLADELAHVVGTLNGLVNSGAITNKINTDSVSWANEVMRGVNRLIDNMMLDPMSGRIYPVNWGRVVYQARDTLDYCKDLLSRQENTDDLQH